MSPSGSPTWSEAGDDTKRRHVDRGERRSEERRKKKREKRDRSTDRSERRHRRDDKSDKGKGRSSRSRRSPSRSPVNSSPEKPSSSSRRRDERSREPSHGSKRSQRSGESRDSKKKHDSRHRKRSREKERARSRFRSEEKDNGVGSKAEGGGGGGDGNGEKDRSRSRSAERRKGGHGSDKAYGFPPGRANSFDAARKRSESRDREERRGESPSGGEGRKRVRRRSPEKGAREDIQIPMFPGVGMGFFPRGFMPSVELGWGHGMMPMEGPMPPFFRGGRGDSHFMRGGARPPRGGRGSFRGDREMKMGRGGRWQQGGRGFDGGPRGRFAGRGWQGRGPLGPNWDDMPMGGAPGYGGPALPPHGIYGPPPTGPMPPPPTQAPPSQVKDGHQQAEGVLMNASQGPMPVNGGAAPDGLRVSPGGVSGGPGVTSQRGVEGGGPSMGSATTEPGMQQQTSPRGPRRRGLPHGGPGAGFEPSYMAGDGRMMPPPHGAQKHGWPHAAAHDHKQKHAPDEHSRGRRGPADAMRGEVVGGNGEERQHGNKRAHAAEMELRKKQPHVEEVRGKEAGRAAKQQQQQQKERQLLKTEAAAPKKEDTDVAAPEAPVKTEELSSEEKARKEEQLKAEQERIEGYLGVTYTLRGLTVPASLAGRQLARAVRLLKRRGLEYDRWCREGEKDGEARSVLTLLMEADEAHADEVEEDEEAVYLSRHDEEGGEGDGHVGSGEHAMAAESAHAGGHAHDVAGGGGDGLYGDIEGGDMGDLYGDLEEEAAHAAKREDPTRIIADLNALRAPVIHEPIMTMQEADRLQRLFDDVSQALQAQAVG